MIDVRTYPLQLMAEHATPDNIQRARLKLGSRLRTLRQERSLNGRDLARVARMSPAKISKIERGRVPTTDITVQRLAEALNVNETIRSELVALVANTFESRNTEGVVAGLEEWCASSASAQHIDSYCMSAAPLFLQTPATLYSLASMYVPDDPARYMLVQAQRQAQLWDHTKRIHMVMHESALQQQFLDARETNLQLDRLESIDLPHVTLGIIPTSASSPSPAFHCYSIEDGAVRTVGLEGVVEIKQPQRYLDHFTEMKELAVYGRQALHLIEQARPQSARHSGRQSYFAKRSTSTAMTREPRPSNTLGARQRRLTRFKRHGYFCIVELDQNLSSNGLPVVTTLEQLRQLTSGAGAMGIPGVILNTACINNVSPTSKSAIMARLVVADEKLSDFTRDHLSSPATAAAYGADAVAVHLSGQSHVSRTQLDDIAALTRGAHHAGMPVLLRITKPNWTADNCISGLHEIEALNCDLIQVDLSELASALPADVLRQFSLPFLYPLTEVYEEATLRMCTTLGYSGVSVSRALLRHRHNVEHLLNQLDIAFASPFSANDTQHSS